MKVTLKTITPEAEVNIVEIARVSSNRTDKSENPAGLINYLIKNNHWSPFEHSSMTVEIITSKSIGIQLLRHRSFTFQEFSQRYSKVENIEDIELRYQADKNRQSSTKPIGKVTFIEDSTTAGAAVLLDKDIEFQEVHVDILNSVFLYIREGKLLYNKLLEVGVAKECARMILPMATQTTIFMTGTIRSWIHMLQIRDDSHAQKEVQLVAREIKKIFVKECPIISTALNWELNSM